MKAYYNVSANGQTVKVAVEKTASCDAMFSAAVDGACELKGWDDVHANHVFYRSKTSAGHLFCVSRHNGSALVTVAKTTKNAK